MIQLNPDYLLFETASGEKIPCSAEAVTVELIGESVSTLDPVIVKNAAAAVLHYFREELGRQTVSVAEFSLALEHALRSFGLSVQPVSVTASEPQSIQVSDLRQLAAESGKGFELFFFGRLREELALRLKTGPHLVHFDGLRGCVKQLRGARRWSRACQDLSDQIADYLRQAFLQESAPRNCALMVS